MAHPVVHFEIIGKNPESLRNYFGELFGWQFDTSSPVAEAVSEPANYGFVDRIMTPDGTGIPGGIGGGASYPGHVIFYVPVPNVDAALAEPSSSAPDASWDPNGRRGLVHAISRHRGARIWPGDGRSAKRTPR